MKRILNILLREDQKTSGLEVLHIKVILHSPDMAGGMAELQCKTALLHAEIVHEYISKLNCPKEQKLELIKAILSNNSDSDGTLTE